MPDISCEPNYPLEIDMDEYTHGFKAAISTVLEAVQNVATQDGHQNSMYEAWTYSDKPASVLKDEILAVIGQIKPPKE